MFLTAISSVRILAIEKYSKKMSAPTASSNMNKQHLVFPFPIRVNLILFSRNSQIAADPLSDLILMLNTLAPSPDELLAI